MALPILAYHSLDESTSPTSIAPAAFEWQMRALQRWGYRGLSLREWWQQREALSTSRAKPCILTFDDGYLSTYTHAWPILQALGFTATVFLVTDKVGQANDWATATDGARLALMTWEQVDAMHRGGMDFAPHSRTHVRLPSLAEAAAEDEIVDSRRCIEERLQTAPGFFCYPYGACNDRIRQVVQRAGFCGAVTSRLGGNTRGMDPYAIERIDSRWFRRHHLWFWFWVTNCGSATVVRAARAYAALRKKRMKAVYS
jgi:peptidoglycan/xylan/chitin deacetylase (PgdA/CDA1 family)